MSATTADRRSITELRRMDEQTAMQTLTMAEYQRWESVNDHHDRAEQVRQEWRETEAEATSILVNTDVSDLATDIELFGNDVAVYYDREDPRLHEAAEAAADVLGVDIDDAADLEATTDDVPREAIDDAADVATFTATMTYEASDGSTKEITAGPGYRNNDLELGGSREEWIGMSLELRCQTIQSIENVDAEA